MLTILNYSVDESKTAGCVRCDYSRWLESEEIDDESPDFWGGLFCTHKKLVEKGAIVKVTAFGRCDYLTIDIEG